MDATAENCPTWLKQLYGESPVLGASEWRLLLKVRSIAQEEFGMNTSSVDGGKMSKELSSLIDKLKELVRKLKACEESKRDFQKYYLRWEPVRNKNIKILREIANEIQKKKEETNNDKYFESFTSFVAGAISFAARRHPVTAIIAGGVAVLCSVAAYGSSCEEAKLIEAKIKQVKDIVKDDKEHFEMIWSWLADSSELRALVDQIVAEMRRNGNMWKNAAKEIESFVCDKKERKETGQDMLIKNMLNGIKISPKFKKEISDVVTVIMAITMVQKRNCSLLKLASSGAEIKSQLVDFARGLLTVLDIPLKFTGINGTRKSIVILRMVLDLVALFNVSEEIQKGSPSKECDTVKKIANILQSEAYALRRMYYEIKDNTRYD